MIDFDVFDTQFDVTLNGKPIFKWVTKVKAFDPQHAIDIGKIKGVTAPIVQPAVTLN